MSKWIKLGGKKDPPANTPLAIWIPVKNDNVDGYWERGFLSRIEFLIGGGKRYIFMQDDNEVEDATHFAIISKPTE